MFELVSTAAGLSRWLDAAELDTEVGGGFRFGMGESVAVGSVLALTAPQHISFGWDWEDQPLGISSVVAFDLIDHGERTHITLRHVGFPSVAQRRLHEDLWSHWFARLISLTKELPTAQSE